MELYEMSGSEAAESIKQKRIKARVLTEAVLSRLKETDKKVNAFITVTADPALQQADKTDRMVNNNEPLPPLAGIPFAFKDNFCLEGVPSTAGSRILQKFPAPYSAAVVEKIMEAGGIVIGKTNMDEFGMGDSTESSVFGVTCNPLEMTRTAGDGVAAAVACGQSLIGVGSDAGGGIRIPASYCGVAGLRPTPGLLSRYGLTSFSSSMAQVGFISRKAGDFSPLLDAVSGFDARDSATSDCPPEGTADSMHLDGRVIKVGYPEDVFKKAQGPFCKVINDLTYLFAPPQYELQKVTLPYFPYGLMAYYMIVIAESFSNLSRYDGIRFGSSYEGDNLEEMYRKTRRSGMGEEAVRRSIIGAHLMTGGNFEKYYEKALRVWSIIREDFKNALKECDLLILPVTASPAPVSGEENGDLTAKYKTDEFCAPVSLAGLPSLSLPVGKSEGLPVSIQLAGARFSDKMLINVAGRLEKELKLSFPPVL